MEGKKTAKRPNQMLLDVDSKRELGYNQIKVQEKQNH